MRGCHVALLLIAGCSDDHTTTIQCSGGTTGMLTADAPVVAKSGGDLVGAAIAADTHTTIPADALSVSCAADIVPDGYLALGPAVQFGAEGTWSDRPFLLTLPYKAARLPKNATRGAVRIVAQRAGGQPYF